MNIGTGEYRLESIATLLVSPHSYGQPSKKMTPSILAINIYETFVQDCVPLVDKNEETTIRHWSIVGTSTLLMRLLSVLGYPTNNMEMAMNSFKRWITLLMVL